MATNIIQRTNNAPVNDNTKHNKMMRSMYGVFNYTTISRVIMPTLSQRQPANCKCTNRFSRILYIQLRKKAFVAVLEGLSLLCNLCARMYVRVSRLCANSVFLSRPPTVMQYLSLATALQSIIRFCCDIESSISFIFT